MPLGKSYMKLVRRWINIIRNKKTRSLIQNLDFIKSEDIIRINTYKHYWFLDLKSGNAFSTYRGKRFLSFLPIPSFKQDRNTLKNHDTIYDYFVSAEHIQWTLEEFQRFDSQIIQNYKINFHGKKVLDISGGQGHFLNSLKERYETHGTLTEYNNRAIEFAKNKLDLEAVQFDFQEDSLSQIFKEPFDIVLLRASMMFCQNPEKLAKELFSITHSNSIIIIQHSVIPTLGVLLRTQFDEYNYKILYQPNFLIDIFSRLGFQKEFNAIESDPDPYVYDHDKIIPLTLLRFFYEFFALQILSWIPSFSFRSRDRKRGLIILRRKQTC